MNAGNFAARLRSREQLIGYWVVLDAPVATERIARIGYDYVVLDGQHGLLGYQGLLTNLMAIDAGSSLRTPARAGAGASADADASARADAGTGTGTGTGTGAGTGAGVGSDARTGTVGLVRVEANNPTPIGRALDAGAAGVIVPLVDTAADAARAVAAARYPSPRNTNAAADASGTGTPAAADASGGSTPAAGMGGGVRSYGPMRSGLRIGPVPAEADAATVVLAMIETPQGLANVAEICATPGLDGIYVGPSDLCLSVGGRYPGDPEVADEFNAAIELIAKTARAAGVAAGIHTPDGETAQRYLAAGYTYATVSSDLTHLEEIATTHLETARSAG
ncbi:HpcH/HpaI aldolase family protein [Kribbella solani]|uniref:4-hydroxy-2-oxoheptanedioate aldolase n=1 Tax=Kribbella solani TaxID=236067 RepID=A0A841DNR0_9ACTN|nr:aldolase/citrate lyase family protein [Kribbella solani]MBB5979531.1 4-hydroxy-2-oxoheptanedioate aldolase [Kribbella solani]